MMRRKWASRACFSGENPGPTIRASSGAKSHGGQGGYAEGRPPEHRREEPPAVSLVLLEPLGKQRDQRDRDITAREQVIEEVGDHKGREIDVRFRTRPELPRNHLIPYQPHEPGQEHAARHDQGRYAHFMRCRQSHCLSL